MSVTKTAILSEDREEPSRSPSSAWVGALIAQSSRFWIFFDFALNIAFFAGASLVTPVSWTLQWADILLAACIYSFAFGLIAVGMGYYEREQRFVPKDFLGLGSLASLITLGLTLSIIFFAFYLKLSRYMLIFGSAASFVGLSLTRWGLYTVARSFPYRFAILGDPSPITDEIRVQCKSGKGAIRYEHVDGFLNWLKEWEGGDSEAAFRTLQLYGLADLVLTESARRDAKVVDLSVRAMQAGVRVIHEVDFYCEIFRRFPSKVINENWMVLSGFNVHRNFEQLIKRAFDFTLALFLLILLSPLLLLISLLVKITSLGPVLFIQDRQGRFCKPFRILKFRTMRVEPIGENPPSTRELDPRVTSIGRILRPLHFDELPQLWNILKGEMSFVGPRPEVYSFVRAISKEVPIYEFRAMVRPGLTGLSQISVGYTMDNAQDTLVKLSYDLYYVRNHTFFWDILIMLRTVFVLSRGAH